MKRLFTGLALSLLAATTITVIGQAPAQAASTCYRTVTLQYYDAVRGLKWAVVTPSAGSTASSTYCVMGRGAYSSAVSALQNSLNRCYGPGSPSPVFSPALVVDGSFGSLTESALKKAQARAGTTADGVYGPLTRDALRWFTQRGSSWVCYRLQHPLTLY